MRLSATYTFTAPRHAVWDMLIDPVIVAECLPGCESLEPVGAAGENTYRAVLTVGVGAISGRYEGTVAIVDKQAPSSYRLVVDGRGKGGFVKGEANVSLTEQGNQTRVSVMARAQVGGTVARVGQRLLGGVSKMMMDRFFGCLATRPSTSDPVP